MTSSIKSTSVMESATPGFVLTLLAACSNSVPAAGKEGETTLCEQLSGLLQDKKMVVTELNLLYSYKFGFNLNDALKFAGFDGRLEDFLSEQKCFLLHQGSISLKPPERQLPTALEFLGKKIDDDETASVADTESTTDASTSQFDADHDVNVTGWHSIGARLVDTLSSVENTDEHDLRWKVLGDRVASVFDSDDNEEDGENVVAWRNVGSSVVAALSSDDDEDDEDGGDVVAWRDVGDRIVRACRHSSNDDDGCFEHPEDVWAKYNLKADDEDDEDM